MKYRIYIDEVGNPDLESSEIPNHRFLSLTGVILELGYVAGVVHPEMEEIKRKYFRTHPDEGNKKDPYGPDGYAIHLRITGLTNMMHKCSLNVKHYFAKLDDLFKWYLCHFEWNLS